jgi:hypothetical protein
VADHLEEYWSGENAVNIHRLSPRKSKGQEQDVKVKVTTNINIKSDMGEGSQRCEVTDWAKLHEKLPRIAKFAFFRLKTIWEK